jgi:hypothetical protein
MGYIRSIGELRSFFELLARLFDSIDGMTKKSSESFQRVNQVKSEVKKYGYR